MSATTRCDKDEDKGQLGRRTQREDEDTTIKKGDKDDVMVSIPNKRSADWFISGPSTLR